MIYTESMVVSPVMPFTRCVVVQLESTGHLVAQGVQEICAKVAPLETQIIHRSIFNLFVYPVSFFSLLSPLFCLVSLLASVQCFSLHQRRKKSICRFHEDDVGTVAEAWKSPYREQSSLVTRGCAFFGRIFTHEALCLTLACLLVTPR